MEEQWTRRGSDAWHRNQAAIDAGTKRIEDERDWSYLHQLADDQLQTIASRTYYSGSQSEEAERAQAVIVLAIRRTNNHAT